MVCDKCKKKWFGIVVELCDDCEEREDYDN